MKKGDNIIAVTSVKLDGELHKPGKIFEVGKNITAKAAKRFFEHDAVKRYFEEDKVANSEQNENDMTIEEMAVLEDLTVLKVPDLKKVCEHLGLEGYSSMNKPDLIKLIEASRNVDEDVDLDELDLVALKALATDEEIEFDDDVDEETLRDIIEEAMAD